MCSIFSVCSEHFPVIMMSMTSCNLLLASSGASHPLGVLSNGMTLPVPTLYANARSSPKQTHCPCCVMGLTAIRGLRTSACRSSMVMSLPSVSLDTRERRPSSQTTDLPTVECGFSGFRVAVTTVPSCCWMPCQHHGSARCRVDSERDASAPSI